MRSVKKIITTAQINALSSGQEIVLDIFITPDQYNSDVCPRACRIINETNAKLGYILRHSIADETKERLTKPEYYSAIPIESGISDLSLGSQCHQIIIQRLDDSVSATKDLVLYFTNYIDF